MWALIRHKAAESMPHILTRSEVVDVVYDHISPIAKAIGEVDKATSHLQKLTERYQGVSKHEQQPE
jgi:hypothetical protein